MAAASRSSGTVLTTDQVEAAAERALTGLAKGGELRSALASTPFRSEELEALVDDLGAPSCRRIMVLSFVRFYGPTALSKAFVAADADGNGALDEDEIGSTLVAVMRESVGALRSVLLTAPAEFAALCEEVGRETEDPAPAALQNLGFLQRVGGDLPDFTRISLPVPPRSVTSAFLSVFDADSNNTVDAEEFACMACAFFYAAFAVAVDAALERCVAS